MLFSDTESNMTERKYSESMHPKDMWSSALMKNRLARRHREDALFKWIGLSAVVFAMLVLVALLVGIGMRGAGAFQQTKILVDIHFEKDAFKGVDSTVKAEFYQEVLKVDFGGIIRNSLRREFPEVQGHSEVRALQSIVSRGERSVLRDFIRSDPSKIGEVVSLWLTADDEVDLWVKQGGQASEDLSMGKLSQSQVDWLETFQTKGRLRLQFNTAFLSGGDSRDAENAGILGALVGTILSLVIALLVAFPLGVSASVYLEEFSSRGKWARLIEVNVNNLAAVPSIVYGLLGLALFLGVLNMPRSAPLVGGLTLGLMTLPTIIISSRAALKAVPPSIREAAIGIGSSPMQVVVDHVLPAAMPGILTGTILGAARALGETAPLLMIGMVAFVVDIPTGFLDAATALPVQIFLWADSPERAFVEKTAGAIIVLLGFLLMMNALAIWLRQRYEVKW